MRTVVRHDAVGLELVAGNRELRNDRVVRDTKRDRQDGGEGGIARAQVAQAVDLARAQAGRADLGAVFARHFADHLA